MKLLIVRHGDPDYEIDSLTEKGWKEAEYLSERLSRLNVKEFYETLGVRQCALQGLEIIQVEILSGKELTTPPEVSFELLTVTLVAKRKQRDSRDSY